MSLVFLIGMPGSGKSHWAKLWAQAFNWQWQDTDHLIEGREGKIHDIFAHHGEPFFREKEQEVLTALIADPANSTIIATGGGLPFYHHNLAMMKTAGCVVYLQATAEELFTQLQADPIKRPLLQRGDLQEEITALLQTRTPVYTQAHLTLAAKSLTPATFAEIISVCTNRHL